MHRLLLLVLGLGVLVGLALYYLQEGPLPKPPVRPAPPAVVRSAPLKARAAPPSARDKAVGHPKAPKAR